MKTYLIIISIYLYTCKQVDYYDKKWSIEKTYKS